MPAAIGLLAYRLGLKMYLSALKTAALLGHDKAQLWITGRKDWEEKLNPVKNVKEKKVWVHCASLGEYEMAVPLMQKIKEAQKETKIILTFFSPSGFEHCGDSPHFDYKFYLLLDSKQNAKYFIQKVNPSVAIFVKYELWYFYLQTLNEFKIPTFLINAQWNGDAIFFRWYGSLHRRMLGFFSKVFVNDEASYRLGMQILEPKKLCLMPDSRIERILSIAAQEYALKGIENFKQNKKIIIAGSSYQAEERILYKFMLNNAADFKLIIAPHEIGSRRIEAISKQFMDFNPIYLSKWETYSPAQLEESNVLIVDGIGLLSKLYRFADAAIIGGGFNGALHNAYEALVYQIPVFYGLDFGNSSHWKDLLMNELAFELKSSRSLEQILKTLLNNNSNSLEERHQAFWSKHRNSKDIVLADVLESL